MSNHPTLHIKQLTKLGIMAGLLSAFAHPALAVTEDNSNTTKKADIEVSVSGTAPVQENTEGKKTFDAEDVKRNLAGAVDLNQITRTIPGVQFDNKVGSISDDSTLDLRPSRLSISGSRPYENNFVIEGLSTTSVLDSTNTNAQNSAEVVGHPQTAFLNPALVDTVEVYSSDVPAEFGDFTGGVVSAKLRDPRPYLRFGGSYSHNSSAWTRYLVSPEHLSATMPGKPHFEKENSDYYVDLPLSKTSNVLIAYSRAESLLENAQRSSQFGFYSNKAKTISENVTFKYMNKISDKTTLRVTSIYSPYNQENFEQELATSKNDGFVNKAELVHKNGDKSVEAKIGYSWHSTDRHQVQDFFLYKNMGSVNWVAASNSTAAKGGFGDLISRQEDTPIGIKAETGLWSGAKLTGGLDYTHTFARKARPHDNSNYRHQTVATAKLDPRVTSADGPNDRTVIEGEQGLNYRVVLRAYDTKASMDTVAAWSQLSDKGHLGSVEWSYRAGLRHERNNFLNNDDVAPRTSLNIRPFSWLTLSAGYNRYYSNTLLSYKLREDYPALFNYTRTGKLNSAGKLVFSSADWTLASQSLTTGYAAGGLKTPYSDEYTSGAKFDFKLLGSFDVKYVKRQYRDQITRDAGTTTNYTKEDGTASTYKLYRSTNGGFTNYHGWNLSWQRSWKDNRLEVNSTISKTKTSSTTSDNDPDYWDSYSETSMNDTVYYNGQFRTRRDIALERSNFAQPTYVNFIWSSDWLKSRLKVDLIGRWNTAYHRVENSGTTVTVNGGKYELYEDVNVPSFVLADVNLSWLAWRTQHAGKVDLTLKVSNVLNRLPHSEGATTTTPYEVGRSVLAGVRYDF